MSKGLAVPVYVTHSGGSATSEGDEQASKVILLALSDNDSDNAFQQGIGLGSDAVFAMSDAGTRAFVTNRVKEIFAEFERLRLYKLKIETITWSKGGTPGDLDLEFQYINLESDEVKAFKKTFKKG